MMTKIILLDIDGLLIRRKRLFSRRLEKEYSVPSNKIQPFFNGAFLKCEIGKADLKKELKKVLPTWGWKKSIAGLLDFWFTAESAVDKKLLKLLDEIHSEGIKIFLQTNQERYRTTFLWKKIGFNNHFDGIFSSCDLGHLKPSRYFWEKIHQTLKPAKKMEIMVWDDSKKNYESAKRYGFDAHLYRGFKDFSKKVASLQKRVK